MTTLEDLKLSPVLRADVRLSDQHLLSSRQVHVADGFVYVETTTNGQPDVVAYPAARVHEITFA